MIEIDGSYLEAGGQIIAMVCSLSATTGQPCRVFNICQGKETPGLTRQCLLEIQALAQLCSASLEGDHFGSKEIIFSPKGIQSENIHIKFEGAEAIISTLQSLILPASFSTSLINQKRTAPVKIIFNGGATDTFFSPTIDYFRCVFLKILEKIGIKVEINILKRGYHPEGGANVEVKIYPASVKRANLTERGEFKKIMAISGASELLRDKKVAERQLAGVREILGKLKLPLEEIIEYYQTESPGNHICLVAEFENTVIGTDNIGKLDKRAEDVGKEAALELLEEQKSQACLDKRSTSQILPYLALAGKNIKVAVPEINNCCKANILIIEKFLSGKFKISHNNVLNWESKASPP